MGLTRDFSRLVVMCAHGSTTENNPYQASLDCGACGGTVRRAGRPHRGGHPQPGRGRAGLRSVGIDIPDDTWFIAAQHDHRGGPGDAAGHPPGSRRAPGRGRPAARRPRLAGALHWPPSAARPARRHRSAGAGAGRRPCQHRSSDWAQVYPEWGLAGNAAFVVAPRSGNRGTGPAAPDLPALVRSRGRHRRIGIGNDPDRPAGGRPVDQLPVLLLHGVPAGVRRRHQDHPQRGGRSSG